MIARREFLAGASASAILGAVSGPARATPAARRLVLVHGRDQQGKNPADLQSQWLAALRRGAAASGRQLPASLAVSFPYYGDVLDRFARAAQIPLTADIQARGDGSADRDFLEFEAAAAEQLRRDAGISEDDVAAQYGSNPEPRGPENWKWVQAIFRSIDDHFSGVSSGSIEAFLRDVYLYTNRAGVRDEIDRIVGAALTEEPAVVVAHSLGSVVAYNILRTDRRALHVPLYVTVGCPLAIRAIRDQFLPLRFPQPPVAAWKNARDARDVVALDPLDPANFPVSPPIANFSGVSNHTANRHGIDGYLDDPTVAGWILDALT